MQHKIVPSLSIHLYCLQQQSVSFLQYVVCVSTAVPHMMLHTVHHAPFTFLPSPTFLVSLILSPLYFALCLWKTVSELMRILNSAYSNLSVVSSHFDSRLICMTNKMLQKEVCDICQGITILQLQHQCEHSKGHMKTPSWKKR